MLRLLLFFFSILIVLLSSCNESLKKERTPHSLEFLNVGLPDKIDTTNLKKIGAKLYIKYDENSDSLLIKIGANFLPSKDGFFHLNTESKYYKVRITDEQKNDMIFLANYFLSQKEGTISLKKDSNRFDCNLSGTWAIIYTDSIGIKHYYNFQLNGVPKQLESICEEFYLKASLNEFSSRNIVIKMVNTDSIMMSLLRQKSMKDIRF